MARPIQEGFSYFSFDVDFFQDPKIRALKAHFKSDGENLYIRILCLIYDQKGYYIQTDEDFIYIMADDMGLSAEKIGMMLNFMLNRSLFDNTLFSRDKVLTSRGIQKRFQAIAKSRKRTVEVIKDFWLLKNNETEGFIKVAPKNSFSWKNPDKSEKNPDKSEKNGTKEKEKESKVKENKIKEYNGTETPSARTRFKKPSAEDIAAYCQERNNGVDPQRFFDYYESNGWKVGKNPMKDWRAAVRTWEKNGIDIRPQKAKTTGYEQRQYTDEELERVFERREDAND